MTLTETERKKMVEEKLKERYRIWAAPFKVCAQHKKDYFEDYEYAVVSDPKYCVLCHPVESDALGG